MATVPIYSSSQVDPQALPGPRQQSVVTPDFLDAGAELQMHEGKQTAAAGTAVSALAVKMAHEEDLRGVQDAAAKYQKAAQDFTLDAKDKRTGVAAVGVTKDFDDWHTKTVNEFIDTLPNDAQKSAFATMAGRSGLAVRHDLGGFEVQQRKAAGVQAFKDYTTNTVNLVASAATNDAAVVQVDGLKANTLAFSATQNYKSGSDEEKALMQEVLTQAHVSRIANMVTNNPIGAREYFTANKDEIAGTQWDNVSKLLKSGDTKILAQNTATELQAKGMDEAQGLDYIRDTLKGDEQAAAALEWKTRWRERDDARERAQKTAADKAWDVYAKTGRLSQVPPAVMAAMDGRDVVAIRKAAERAATDKAVKTDFTTLYDLRKMSVDSPEAFLKLDLNRYRDRLSPADLEQFAILQTKPEKRQDAATLDAQLSNMHDQMGWGASDREKKGLFDKTVTDAVNVEQKRLGKPLDYEQRKKIIDRMVIDGEVLSGHWYLNDPNKRYYEVAGSEDASRFAPKVPDRDKQDITAALKRAGKPVTDAAILQLFKRKNGLE